LLWLLSGAFVSGWVSFATERPLTANLAAMAHGMLGMGVVVLIPWKSMIVRRARPVRPTGLALTVLVLACLLAGFAQLFLGYADVLGLSPIQIHVGAACLAIGLVGWHVFCHRRQRVRAGDLSRRTLLRAAGLAAAAGASYALLTALSGWTGGARRPSATGSRAVQPDTIPATIWLFDPVPLLDNTTYRILVAGRTFDLAALAASAQDVRARLDCTSGWYADAVWRGPRLSDLIPPSLLASSASLRITSVTGYTRCFPAREAGRLWLALACQGTPLTAATGAPVRLVAPGRRGFWWVKWVASVELTATPSWVQLPFPDQ